MSRKNKIRESVADRVFQVVVVVIVTIITLTCILPIINILASSLSSANANNANIVTFWPIEITLDAYKSVVTNGALIRSMFFSIYITILTVAITLVMTILCAYPLSHRDLVGKSILWPFIMFTMYFGGGMIPSYLLLNSLKLLNTEWCLVLPGAISTYNMILMRTYFSSIPDALRESATIDGANDFVTLTRIMLPLSKSMLATIALFYAVGRWNAVTDGMIYINEPEKYILQVRLKNIILNAQGLDELMAEGANMEFSLNTTQMRCATLMFSLIPVLIVYPFLQKYFVKGVMIGSVKG